MPTDTQFGTQTEAEWQQVRATIKGWAKQELNAGREFTTGILLEDVRTKLFPDDDTIPDAQKSVAFVANVKLINVVGRPVVRDVLVANQARQWVADAVGTPVVLKMSSTGELQVVGRAAVDFSEDDYVVKYVPIQAIDGNNLDFLFGLEYVLFGALDAGVQTKINAYRATLGLVALVAGDGIYIDPVIHVLGTDYVPGYVPAEDSVRGSTGGTLTCRQETVIVPWTDSRWLWGSSPVGWPASTSSWGLKETVTTCVSTP